MTLAWSHFYLDHYTVFYLFTFLIKQMQNLTHFQDPHAPHLDVLEGPLSLRLW